VSGVAMVAIGILITIMQQWEEKKTIDVNRENTFNGGIKMKMELNKVRPIGTGLPM